MAETIDQRRKCLVLEVDDIHVPAGSWTIAYFHRWAEVPESREGTHLQNTVAIVEWTDGRVEYVLGNRIKFEDWTR